ncbi:hypothetical protein [Elioraea thermophila]|uniref:hypothetical protein n=1 Tax=Elioraea thermophila TaxID=2185104 RepID=UPI000DF3803C|nr:hypothetical protein [Elioraea thermophila]
MTDLSRQRLYLRAWLAAEGRLPDPSVAPVRLSVRTAGSIPPKADMARAGYLVVVWTWRARGEVTRADIEAWEEAHIAAIRDDGANPEVPMTDEAGNPIASAEGGAVPARRKVNYHGTVLARTSVFAPPGRTLQSLWGAWGEGRRRLERILTVKPEFLTDDWERAVAATIHAMRLMMEGEPQVTIIDPSLPL